MRHAYSLALLVLAAACSDPAAPRVAPAELPDRPSHSVSTDEGQPVVDQYIVVFRDDVADAAGLAQRLSASHGGELRYTYRHAVKGFAARMSAQAAAALSRNPTVRYVEQDQVVTVATTQSGATWGLDRIDQGSLPLSKTYSYTSTGTGVSVYILDTGIRRSHTEFGGRASSSGYDAIGDGQNGNDCNGHGTHVAGTVGGAKYGVAKGATLVPVRVLDCNGYGTTAQVIAGVDWITAWHVKPAVVNVSLIESASTALDDAVRRSVAAGMTYAVAAGNGNWLGRAQDACKYSPGRVPGVLTIGATTSSDSKVSSSNYGTCLDLFAPGGNILSAAIGSDTHTTTKSGTSMAAPHVAGVAALYLQRNPTATPADVAGALIASATPDKVTSAGSGSPNRLLFTAY